MTKEEILETVLNYVEELNDEYEENQEAFGHDDPDTQRSYTKLYALEELLIRLSLPTND